MSMSRRTITLLDHRRQSIIQERKERHSKLLNYPTSRSNKIDHPYNTVKWLSDTNQFQQPSDYPNGDSNHHIESSDTEGKINLGFEATSYDDIYLEPAAGSTARPRPSRVTFS